VSVNEFVRLARARVSPHYYPPNASLLQSHYEHLPEKLAREGVDPQIPWLYNLKIDFRSK